MERIKITPEEGWEIDVENSTLGDIAFKKIEKGLPKTWEELKIVSGWYVSAGSKIREIITDANPADRNVFSTEEQAKASIALAQLSQLIQVYNDGWVADYTDKQVNYSISFYNNDIFIDYHIGFSNFLTFKTEAIRNDFLENFRVLIETAKPLL